MVVSLIRPGGRRRERLAYPEVAAVSSNACGATAPTAESRQR